MLSCLPPLGSRLKNFPVSKSKTARLTCTRIWKINLAINPVSSTPDSILEFSSFEDRVELLEFRVTVNLNLTGTAAILLSIVNGPITLKEMIKLDNFTVVSLKMYSFELSFTKICLVHRMRLCEKAQLIFCNLLVKCNLITIISKHLKCTNEMISQIT